MKYIHRAVEPSPPSISRLFHLPKLKLGLVYTNSPFPFLAALGNQHFAFCFFFFFFSFSLAIYGWYKKEGGFPRGIISTLEILSSLKQLLISNNDSIEVT